MKRRVGKKADTGRQRRTSDWQKPPSYSYHAQRAERDEATGRQSVSLASKRHRMLSAQFWAKRSGLVTVLIVAVICLISILSVSSSPRIVLLNDTDGSYAFHDAAEYQAAAKQYLGSSVWNKNKITVNTGAASTDLQKKFPELADVSITLPFIGHRPVYHLQANSPAFVVQAVNGTYVLDSSGKALLAKAALPVRTADTLPVITDQTGLHVVIGRQVISNDEASFIRTVLATLKAKQVTVASLNLPAGVAQELDIQVNGRPYYIKFNMHDAASARQQAGTYLATIANLDKQHIAPTQYVDVRVLGRAYYQ